MIAFRRLKDTPEQQKQMYLGLDSQYESEKIKAIPIPGQPHTFSWGIDYMEGAEKADLKNKDIDYQLY